MPTRRPRRSRRPGRTHTRLADLDDDEVIVDLEAGPGPVSPEVGVSLFSALTFNWMVPLLRLGNQRPLEHADLPPLHASDGCAAIHRRLQAVLAPRLKRRRGARRGAASRSHGEQAARPKYTARVLAMGSVRAFGGPFICAAAFKLVHDSLLFVGPQLLRHLIRFLEEPAAPTSQGVGYAALLLLSGMVQSVCLRQYFFRCFRTGMRVRSAVVALVYRKALTVDPSARQTMSTGKVTNLMSVDAQRMQDLTPYLQSIWFSFYQISLCIYFLWREVGAACLAGVTVLCVMIPISARLSFSMRQLQQQMMVVKDRRILLCHEALGGIKTLKMQAWEDPMRRKVMQCRDEELRLFARFIARRAMLFMAQSTAPLLVTIATFAAFTAEHDLDVSTAFVCLALFDILRSPLWQLPRVINNIIEAKVSLTRLADFLGMPDKQVIGCGGLDVGASAATQDDDGIGNACIICMQNGFFAWSSGARTANAGEDDARDDGDDAEAARSPLRLGDGDDADGARDSVTCQLRRINLEVRRGERVAIIGHVGSGKSSLLSAVLGEMRRTQGSVAVARRVLRSTAYVAQTPFILNASLKDNVLFGKPLDPARYDSVLDACALLPDIAQLPRGDQTEIGEKGINLSGGQKARVSLARAVYADADLYLIDDPLSAVDAHVAAHIFSSLFESYGRHGASEDPSNTGGEGDGDEVLSAVQDGLDGISASQTAGGGALELLAKAKAMTRAREAGSITARAKVCQEGGLLAGKTVLMVTNAMQFLSSKHIDRIVVMRPPGGQMQRPSDQPVTVDGIAIAGSDDDADADDEGEGEDKGGQDRADGEDENTSRPLPSPPRSSDSPIRLGQLGSAFAPLSSRTSPESGERSVSSSIVSIGTFAELMADGGDDSTEDSTDCGTGCGAFKQLMAAFSEGNGSGTNEGDVEGGTVASFVGSSDEQHGDHRVTELKQRLQEAMTRGNYEQVADLATHLHELEEELRAASATDRAAATGADEPAPASSKQSPGGSLMSAEERTYGDVSARVYAQYAKQMGGCRAAMCVLLGYSVGQIAVISSRWWLSYWSEHAETSGHSQGYYLRLYAVFALAQCLCLLAQYCTCMYYGLCAARRSFEAMLARILRAPMAFFDTTPMGRVMNRFSKEVYTIDEQLPQTWNSYLQTLFTCLGTVFAIIAATPSFAAALLPILALYVMSQRFFIKTSRELKRLDSISRSPLYAHFGETLDGVATVRAYSRQPDFCDASESHLDRNQRAYFLTFTANCWLAIRLELAGTFIVFFAALCAVLGRSDDRYFPGMAGLSISFALSVTQSLNWSVRMASDREAQMVSVERCREYSELPIERVVPGAAGSRVVVAVATPVGNPVSSPFTSTPMGWAGEQPGTGIEGVEWLRSGRVSLQRAVLRYRPGLDPVLRKVTFDVRAGEKVGVCGRTGAGKSSVILALLRIVELDSGTIRIDDRDISTLHLDALRRAISVIPQDPVLFSGSVRENLDPFDSFNDDALHTVLRQVNLDTHVAAMAEKDDAENGAGGGSSLDAQVTEAGGNFSLGQRQLICIARALLRQSKLVLLDEATSSVDVETDNMIQSHMRSRFTSSTVITVAHRINTIIDSDRVLVLERGRVAEFAPPHQLLAEPQSLFHALVHEHEHSRDIA